MAAYATLHIYGLLLEKLGRQKSTTLQELKDFLAAHDFDKSERTIARYLEQMRHELGLEIVYSAAERGYAFHPSDDFDAANFLKLLHLSHTSGFEIKSRKQLSDLLPLVQFDTGQGMPWIGHLKSLLFAIQHRRYIRFNHTNYHTKKTTPYRIQPILLKEYQYRWYVIGAIESGEYRTFGCDRIANLEIETKTFPASNNSEVRKKFEQIVGLDYSNEKVEKVRLSLTPIQATYLNAAPLHPSQFLESKTRDEVVMTYHLIPNYEFMQKILMLGDQVKVMAPAKLRFEIKKLLRNALENYRDEKQG